VFFSTFDTTWVMIAIFMSMTVRLAIRALWWTLGVRGFSTVILVLRRNSILYMSKLLVAFLISTKKSGNGALSEKAKNVWYYIYWWHYVLILQGWQRCPRLLMWGGRVVIFIYILYGITVNSIIFIISSIIRYTWNDQTIQYFISSLHTIV